MAPAVSIVTLCSYDPASSPLTPLSASNKYRYARKHGYQLYFETKKLDPDRPPAWSKVCGCVNSCVQQIVDVVVAVNMFSIMCCQVAIVKKYLKVSQWVAWVDCDSFFMDDSKPITDLIPDPTRHPDINFVISEDGLTVNTGVNMAIFTAYIIAVLNY